MEVLWQIRKHLADSAVNEAKPAATFLSDDEDHPTLLTEIVSKPFLTTCIVNPIHRCDYTKV